LDVLDHVVTAEEELFQAVEALMESDYVLEPSEAMGNLTGIRFRDGSR
jgi:hypothetical protein